MSKGRTYLNKTLLPYFANFFEDKSVIREAGKHRRHHYSVYFDECDFKSIDLTNTDGAEIQDDLENLSLPDNSIDGFLFVGMHDVLKNPEKAMQQILRVLKHGGRVLASMSGPGYQNMQFGINNIAEFMKGFIIDDIRFFYGPEGKELYTDGPMTVSFVIARKPQ
ncbi:MAG TPA: class I SAM-dependent methyltransferase [bacterium]|nr:class I SAM-dependent methyltransferase [bacterium]